jgi:hypothetical protein
VENEFGLAARHDIKNLLRIGNIAYLVVDALCKTQ